MPSEFKEGTPHYGRLFKVQPWPTVSNAPGRFEVIRITFEIYSLISKPKQLRCEWRYASFEVIVGSAIKSPTMSHKSLALAVKVQNPSLADDWFRLIPQRGDRTVNRNPDPWVQLTFKPVQPGEAVDDYRQMFDKILPFDTGGYEIIRDSPGRDPGDLLTLSEAAEQLGPPWNYQRLRRRIKRLEEQGALPSKLISLTPRGQMRVYFRYLKAFLR